MGSGKGYLSSFLSLQYGLSVFGIDSSSTNTHGALERNRKLKKFSRAYQKHSRAGRARGDAAASPQEEPVQSGDDVSGVVSQEEAEALIGLSDVSSVAEIPSDGNSRAEDLFLSAFSVDVAPTTSPRIPPDQLSAEEKERRKRENLERKAESRADNTGALFSPLTSYVTPETELRELIDELEVRKCRLELKKYERNSCNSGWSLHYRSARCQNLRRVIINKSYH